MKEGGVAVARGPGSGALVIRRAGVWSVYTKPQYGSGPSASDQRQPTPVGCIVGSWCFAGAMWPRTVFSYVAATTNNVRETKTSEQFDNEGHLVGVSLEQQGIHPSMEIQADVVEATGVRVEA